MTVAVSAQAAITPLGQFSGTLSETFESFQNFVDNPLLYEPEPFVVFGGNASFDSTSNRLGIYEPSIGVVFGLFLSGSAQVSDGVKAMGMDLGPHATWQLTFASDITDFGAFWAASTSRGPEITFVEFFDVANMLVGSTSFVYDHEATADGGLDWNGWNSDIAFRSVKVTGNYVVVDGMQANVSAVPEPATISVLALGALAMLRRRKLGK